MKSNNEYFAVLNVKTKDAYITGDSKELFYKELTNIIGEDAKDIECICTCCEDDIYKDVTSLCTMCSEYYNTNTHIEPTCPGEIHIVFKKEDVINKEQIKINPENKIIEGITISKVGGNKEMEKILLKQVSKETRDLIEDLIIKSPEGIHLGLESYDYLIDDIIQGVQLSDGIARDNVLLYGGYDPLYIEDFKDSVMIKEGLNEEEKNEANKQLNAYLKELSYLSMVNYKIKEVHKLILEGALS